MALRPAFVPDPNRPDLVRRVDVEFKWHPGFAPSQKQKSVQELHSAAKAMGIHSPLEVSTKSQHGLGQTFSAFRLSVRLRDGSEVPLESAYQASKRFEEGGPYLDLQRKNPKDAKRDPRLRSSGRVIGFVFEGTTWPISPSFLFYDWLFLRALRDSNVDPGHLSEFDAFTDIEFNPAKSLNTQAHAAALVVALQRLGRLGEAQNSAQGFMSFFGVDPAQPTRSVQEDLFLD